MLIHKKMTAEEVWHRFNCASNADEHWCAAVHKGDTEDQDPLWVAMVSHAHGEDFEDTKPGWVLDVWSPKTGDHQEIKGDDHDSLVATGLALMAKLDV